jgi:hypothetical protein
MPLAPVRSRLLLFRQVSENKQQKRAESGGNRISPKSAPGWAFPDKPKGASNLR